MRSIFPFLMGAVLTVGFGAPALAQQVTVVNGTHFAVLSLRTKPHRGGSWSADMLNQITLGVRQSRVLRTPDNYPCNVDFLAILSDGHKLVLRDEYICGRVAVAIADDRH